MHSFIKKTIFGENTKTTSAANIFIILCFYAAFTTVYGYFVVDTVEMLVRLAIGVSILACQVFCERGPINKDVAAFLLPTYIISAIFFGAIYSGDVLVFIYIVGAAMLSLTYLKPKSILFYIFYCIVVGSLIVFVFDVRMMGEAYSFTHNAIFLVVSIVLSIVVYIFCGSYAKTIDNLIEAENNAMLAAKAKGNFLARMSHEIRTPLNAIIGLTEAQLRKDISEDEKGALANIQSSGKLLLGIINDILDLSKIESGKFDLIPEEYSVAEVVYDITNLNVFRIGAKPLYFNLLVDPSIPGRLIGDSLRIKQMLNNLLSNAFKYTNEGSVTLGLRWASEDGKARLIFTVTDTGIGISQDDLDRLFSDYSQVNRQANKAIEGTGLGLSICKWLVELMGGKISAESKFGEGSTFIAEIMQDIADPEPLGEVTAAALADFSYVHELGTMTLDVRPMPYGKVLIVDDVDINLIVAETLMEPYELQVETADSGREAIEKINARETEYDLVFMDHMMPGMDGIEAATAIRALGTDYAKSLPIIALTANAIAGSDKMFMEHGFQGFLAKPIDLQQLDAILHKWVEKR